MSPSRRNVPQGRGETKQRTRRRFFQAARLPDAASSERWAKRTFRRPFVESLEDRRLLYSLPVTDDWVPAETTERAAQARPHEPLFVSQTLPGDTEFAAAAVAATDAIQSQTADWTDSPELRSLLAGLEFPAGQDLATIRGQIFYLDFDGAEDVTYDGPVRIEGIDVPPFSAVAAGLAGHEPEIIASTIAQLNAAFEPLGVGFTATRPAAGLE